MNHEGSVTLETERLVLRPFTPDDADAVYRNWAGDREATRFMPYERASSVEEARNLISRWSDRVFALVLKSTGELIGFVEYDITDEEARTLEQPLRFLPSGKRFEAQIYADGPGADFRTNPDALTIEKRIVTRSDTLRLALAPGGGTAIRFRLLDR